MAQEFDLTRESQPLRLRPQPRLERSAAHQPQAGVELFARRERSRPGLEQRRQILLGDQPAHEDRRERRAGSARDRPEREARNIDGVRQHQDSVGGKPVPRQLGCHARADRLHGAGALQPAKRQPVEQLPATGSHHPLLELPGARDLHHHRFVDERADEAGDRAQVMPDVNVPGVIASAVAEQKCPEAETQHGRAQGRQARVTDATDRDALTALGGDLPTAGEERRHDGHLLPAPQEVKRQRPDLRLRAAAPPRGEVALQHHEQPQGAWPQLLLRPRSRSDRRSNQARARA